MDFDDLTRMVFGVCFAAFGFALKLIFNKLEIGNNRMSQIEIELARQKQQTNDLHAWMERIDDKLEKILDNVK